MKPIGWLIAAIFLAGVLVAGCIALVNDEDAYAPIVLVSHEYDDGDRYRYEEDSGGSGDRRGGDGRYAGGRSGDYDGGPGDDCRNACVNTIIEPSPGGREEEQPR